MLFILMSLMLNLYPKGFKPDLVLCSLFLRQMPLNIQAHLLDLVISNTDALARKADALFQSHQSFAVISLSVDLYTTIHSIQQHSR